jgi:hypothetical protein
MLDFMLAPVAQANFFATKSCLGMATAVERLTVIYIRAPKRIARTIRRKAFFGEKPNSSDACGMVSNPAKAQVDIAKMERILARGVLPGAKYGIKFPSSVPR